MCGFEMLEACGSIDRICEGCCGRPITANDIPLAVLLCATEAAKGYTATSEKADI